MGQKKIILLHWRCGHSKENRFWRFQERVESKWYAIRIPNLPNAEHPKLEEWIRHLEFLKDIVDEETILIGHSMGCIMVNHRLLYLKKIVKRVINVAPILAISNAATMRDAINMAPELEEFRKTILDFNEIPKYCSDYNIYISDNDPYGEFRESIKYFKDKLPFAKIKKFKWFGHFNSDAGISEFPEIIKDI